MTTTTTDRPIDAATLARLEAALTHAGVTLEEEDATLRAAGLRRLEDLTEADARAWLGRLADGPPRTP